MKIEAGTLLKLIPPDRRGKIPGQIALQIVHNAYCGPMTLRGFCTGTCADCQEHLLGAFLLEGARNEQALLTWRLKTALSAAQDSAGERKNTPKTDRFGLPVPEETNPFDALRKRYEEQAKGS